MSNRLKKIPNKINHLLNANQDHHKILSKYYWTVMITMIKNAKKMGHLLMGNWYCKCTEGPQKLKTELPHGPRSPDPGYIHKGSEICVRNQHLHSYFNCIFVHKS